MTVIAPPRKPKIHNNAKRRRWSKQLAKIQSGLRPKVKPRYTLNRANRRKVLRKQRKARQAALHCRRCGLFHIAPTALRCQCQTDQRIYRCSCGYEVIATPREWRSMSFCAACAKQLREQWENEEASRGEAIARYYERQEWDEEQHRIAKERRDIDE